MEAPFFVVGCPRSGTTMLRLMLDAHPRLAIPPESHFVASLAQRRLRLARRPGRALDLALAHSEVAKWDVDPAFLRERVEAARPDMLADVVRALFSAHAEAHGKPRWGDKTPGYVRRIPQLARLLPDALFVHLIRDERPVAVSLAGVPWGPATATSGARWWRLRVRAGKRGGRRMGGERYLEVRYEELVHDPQGELRRVCAFIGEEFDPAVLRPDLRPERLPSKEWMQSGARGARAAAKRLSVGSPGGRAGRRRVDLPPAAARARLRRRWRVGAGRGCGGGALAPRRPRAQDAAAREGPAAARGASVVTSAAA